MAAGDVTGAVATISQKDCAVFDGVDDYVEVAHNANQLGANLSNGFTISAWINPRSTGQNAGSDAGKILSKCTAAGAANGFEFGLRDGGTYLRVDINLSAKVSGNFINFGTWYHVLFTIDNGNLGNFYVNGVLSGTANQDFGAGSISAITTTNAPRIGNRATTTDRTFDGSIKDVKMWNRVLTTDEIAQDYAGSPTATENLILDVPLETDYTDNKGNATTNSGTYLANTTATKLKADVESLTLAAATDKLLIEKIEGRDKQFKVSSLTREA